MTTLTATPDEAAVLDAVEETLLDDWSQLLARGHTPWFILGRIIDAATYEPRFGLVMDPCQRTGCPVLVHGDTHCGEECRDADSADTHERLETTRRWHR